MWSYEKRLQYPVNISTPNPKLAQVILSQFGGPDGELAASMRYLSQRYTMPYRNVAGLLTDIGTSAPVLHTTACFGLLLRSIQPPHLKTAVKYRARIFPADLPRRAPDTLLTDSANIRITRLVSLALPLRPLWLLHHDKSSAAGILCIQKHHRVRRCSRTGKKVQKRILLSHTSPAQVKQQRQGLWKGKHLRTKQLFHLRCPSSAGIFRIRQQATDDLLAAAHFLHDPVLSFPQLIANDLLV